MSESTPLSVVCPECSVVLLRTEGIAASSGHVTHCGHTIRFTSTKQWVEHFDPQAIYDSTLPMPEIERALFRMVSALTKKERDMQQLVELKYKAQQLLRLVRLKRDALVAPAKTPLKFLTTPLPRSKQLNVWRCSVWAMVRLLISEGKTTPCNVELQYKSYDSCAKFIKAHYPSLPIPKMVHPYTSVR